MDNKETVSKKMTFAAKTLATVKKEILDSLKANYADIKRDDFLWHYLLQNYATWGGSSGWNGLIGNKENYRQITFETLKRMKPKERVSHATAIFQKAKVRHANKKGKLIVGCFEKILELGGLIEAKELLFKQNGRDAKIRFLSTFPGTGDKYARNMMMDVYHEDFRNSIAIDSRIENISNQWKLEFDSYKEHECFYLNVAEKAGLNGWELDRLMYRFQTYFYPPLSCS